MRLRGNIAVIMPVRVVARFLLSEWSSVLQRIDQLKQQEVSEMRYAIAWLLGVPASIIVIWFVVGHLL
jgi:hypothetical protein